MANSVFDTVIVGAGPAGATASILLTQKDRRVALIDRDNFPRSRTSAGWLNARAAPLLAELRVPVKPLLDQAFVEVTFHTADFGKSARPNFAEAPGFLIDRAKFDNTLVKTAVDAGVTLFAGQQVTQLRLKESTVIVETAGGDEIAAKQLIIAAGATTGLLESVGVIRSTSARPCWIAQVDAEFKKGGGGSSPRVAVVLGLNRQGSFGILCATSERLSFGITWHGDKNEVLPTLVNLCRLAFAQKLIPVDLTQQAATAPIAKTFGASALDMESHVGKHTLVIGDAGGFVSAASHEGIYPAMWSAQIAAQVADAALKSKHTQDALSSFNSDWRLRMADYLRSPNTDIQFLLPLIFSNQPMADRMGAAFFSGENL